MASCPNAIASKYAAQALRLIGEEVPHKLSQQVPLWTIKDVKEWVKQVLSIEKILKLIWNIYSNLDWIRALLSRV